MADEVANVAEEVPKVAEDIVIPRNLEIRQQPDGRLITSWVTNDPKDWWTVGLLIPHEAIRYDLIKALNHIKSPNFPGTVADKAWRVEHFFKWYSEFYYVFVHHHHDIEESIYFPWALSKIPAEHHNIIKENTVDHVSLIEKMEELKNMQTKFTELMAKPETTDSDLKEFAKTLIETWTSFAQLMCEHLAHEEGKLAPLIGQYATEEEENQKVSEIVKSHSFKELRDMMPFVYNGIGRWGGEARQKKFLEPIPGFLQSKLLETWIPEFKLQWIDLLESVSAEQNTWVPCDRAFFSACTIL